MPTTITNYYLNTKQLTLLRLLYRFRFATSNHLAIALDLKPDTINQKLQILLDQAYIGRNYDGQYKIHGRPAEYYLLEGGIKALKQYMGDKSDNRVLHNIYKDKHAKPSFVAHSLDVFSVYCCLKERYGDKLRFFTKSQLYGYKHFPKQKPDALIRLEVDGNQKEFFLEIIDPNSRFFTYVGRVRRYIEYADEGTWEETAGTNLPKILFVADSVSNEIRFRRQAARFLKKHFHEDPQLFTTSIGLVGPTGPAYDRMWRNAEEPESAAALHEI